MFDALETGFGLDLVLWLQSIRMPMLEFLVKILDFMGEEMLYIGVIALIYWVFNRGLGMRLVFILLLATLTTAVAKDLIATERPYEVSEQVNELVQEGSYGIPSGHVTTSLAVWGYLAYALRRRWVWVLLIAYVLLQSFGRMLAGAHYPQDVVFGWILGGGLLVLYIFFAEKVAAFWARAGNPLKLGIALISILAVVGTVYLMSMKAPLNLTLLENPCPEGAELLESVCRKAPHFDIYFTSLGLFLGAVAVFWLTIDFKPASPVWKRVTQYLIGLAISVALLVILGAVADAISETGQMAYVLRTIRYSMVAFFALGLWPLLSLRFGLLETSKS
jgi:membrane-associated phospholipid phosphatase